MEREELKTETAALEWLCAQVMAGDPESPHYKAARPLYRAIEDALDPNRESPEARKWARIVVLAAEMGEVFGFEKKPAKQVGQAEPQRARVQ
jgi:hypothetical protein